MIVGLPYSPPGGMGGGNRVLSQFERWLTGQGIAWTRDIRACDVALLNAWSSPLVTASILHAHGIPFVHRIDNAASQYGRTDNADDRLKRINAMAAVSLFQSHWARHTMMTDYGLKDGPVAYNPVDTTIFTPEGPPADLAPWTGPKVSCVSWSDNPLKGGADIVALAKANPTVLFARAGRWPEAKLPYNVVDLGVLDASSVAALHRATEALVTYSRSEACPNHVIEAMACGRPVIYYDAPGSATAEIVARCGLPTWLMSEYRHPLVGLLETFREQKTGDQARIRVQGYHTADIVFPQYLDALRKALAEAQPGLLRRVGKAVRAWL